MSIDALRYTFDRGSARSIIRSGSVMVGSIEAT
jgi:hypothetical protein